MKMKINTIRAIYFEREIVKIVLSFLSILSFFKMIVSS